MKNIINKIRFFFFSYIHYYLLAHGKVLAYLWAFWSPFPFDTICLNLCLKPEELAQPGKERIIDRHVETTLDFTKKNKKINRR